MNSADLFVFVYMTNELLVLEESPFFVQDQWPLTGGTSMICVLAVRASGTLSCSTRS